LKAQGTSRAGQVQALTDCLSLTDRVAIITGAAQGIGRATALALSAAGAAIVIVDIDAAASEELAERIGGGGGRATTALVDVSDEAAVDHAIAQAVSVFGRIDILVNNAGLGARTPSVELDTGSWRRAMAVGLDGAFYCSRAAGRHMIARESGAIVNVSSIMGLCGGGLYPNLAYHAAKGGLVNLTRALALEWAPHGVRVNAVAPTFARTRLTEKLLSDPAMESAIIASTPLARLVEPEEVAYAIHFLASDAARMITGHTLPIDGGWLAR
jgi:NAD(P)-dependent dehydrogenase (short-subunit alcohol dehydrogenase family)